jgi:DNA-3-methyladenine glycosylase II
LRELRGLSARKVEWLHGVARAALDGRLDSTHLRALPAEHALANLRELPGIGPFSAELVLLRGAGAPDHFPRHERRLQRAMRDLYGLNETRPDELNQIAENWRPYRTWASVLVRVWLEAQDLSGATRRQGGHGRPAQAAPGSSAR